MDLEERLTPEQREIVETNKDILVLAGPGCGKTATLIHKIKRLIEQGKPPEKILLLSFSLKTSTELKEKIVKAGFKGIRVDTFHGLAYDLWREYHQREPKLVDERESKLILKRLFPKDKEALKDPQKRRIFYDYLEKSGLLDFDTLLLKASQIPLSYRGFYIFIDEFQDISPDMLEFIKSLREATFYLFGDPNQSIYGFRGVDLRTIKTFLDSYKPNIKLLTLSNSFRCPEEILKVASAFQCSPWKIEGFRSLKKGGCVMGYSFDNEKEEATYLKRSVLNLLGGLGLEQSSHQSISPKDIFILARVKRVFELVQSEFSKEGIPVALPEDKAIQLKGEIFSLVDNLLHNRRSFEQSLKEASSSLKSLVKNWMELFDHDYDKMIAHLKKIDLSDLVFPQVEGVNFLSIHSAKGLEAEVVFLVGAEEGLIPLTLFSDTSFEEERRVLYVALTRTKRDFYFSAVKGRKVFNRVLDKGLSNWLKDLPHREIKRKASSVKQTSLF
ncbi:MAG: ATP-dependent helicase [Caldimicrobium sp.]|nr:ATP-dependent helicase [Caldimicrobium sp.]